MNTKKLIACAFMGWIVSGVIFAQGTISFQNFYQPILFAPDYLSDGTTKLSGPQYMAELLAGPSADTLTAIATTSFLSGSSAGYFNGGTQTLPNVLGGATAFVQVDVWNTMLGATFDSAKTSGLPNAWAQSAVFPVITGNPFVPSLPGVLTGLTALSLNAVPEPSTMVLAALGAAFLWFRIVRLIRRSGSFYSPKD